MPDIPFKRAVETLEAAGYRIRNRRSYPDRQETYFYYFFHPQSSGLLIGFPVVRKHVSQKYFQVIQDAIKRLQNDEDEGHEDETG